MAELLEAVVSWPSLLIAIVVFGFAPGFCLRFIVLAYPRDDPRRTELIAELYAVPRTERPFWVAEQLEVAVSEGFGHRLSAAMHRLTRRSLSQYENRRLLGQGISQLPDRDRVVLTLYHFENLTFAEIGLVLGVSKSLAQKAHIRAIRRLRSKIGREPLQGLPSRGEKRRWLRIRSRKGS